MDALLEKINRMGPQEIQAARAHLMVGGGTPGPVLVRGHGVRVEDVDGKSYIDCTSQSWAMYLGFAHPEIAAIIGEHARSLTHVHQGFDTLPRFYLAQKLAELAPDGLNRVSFTVGGGSAIEAAMKIALRNRPGAKEFIALWDAYHGTTLASASASWIGTRASGAYTGQTHFLPLLHTVHRAPNPYCYRCYFGRQNAESCDLMCAEMLRLTIERGVNGPVAGIIMEPLQASGGQIPFPRRYLQRVRQICDEYGILLIFDEIQTFCRIGEWFAAGYYGVTPDILVLGKGLGAGLPIAAIVIRDDLEGFSLKAEELHTFANNSLSQVAAARQIEIIERDHVLENTRRLGEHLATGVRHLQSEFPEIGDVRAVGLHIGVEFVDPASGAPDVEGCVQVRDQGMKHGAIFGLGGARRNVLKIKPPLIVNRAEADEILDILRRAMLRVLRGQS